MIRTKVVATIGPASASPETAEALVKAGMDIARINMSHGNYSTHSRSIRLVREASNKVGRPTAILVDLQGPKIRIGYLPEPVFLRPGSAITIAPEGRHFGDELPTTYMELAKEVEPGTKVLLDDGLLELTCVGKSGQKAWFEVVRGGILHSKKGINLPSVDVSAPSVTEKDLRDLEFAYEIDAAFVGLSFVRRASDVEDLKQRIKGRAWLVAKIEKAQALDELDGILAHSDAVMVARGDLGVELPFEQVPLAQKSIIQRANAYGRPVITATQMLESMTEYPRPTRAEASDVANAILDGTDAVMLSGETAAGKYPVQAVEAMVRIASEIESSGVLEMGPRYLRPSVPLERQGASDREHAVASSSVNAARDLQAPAMIVFTRGGFSARLVASYRPPVPIFAICTDPKVYRQLCGVWGIRPVLAEGEEITYENLTSFGKRCVMDSGLGKEGDPVVVTSGYPFHRTGSTNTMRVERL
ncbi:MAG: pyruvate kinase [Longimicrobiales bacterium]